MTTPTTQAAPADAGPPPADQDQRDVIFGDLGECLFVEAGAGTGKTTELVKRIREIVMTDDVPLRQVAAVTFTEKAAAELRDRLRVEFELIEPSTAEAERRRAEALDEIDSAAIGTLHSFAQRILGQFPIEAGLPPLIEVLDEVASEIAFERRWIDIRNRLLADTDEQVRLALLLYLSDDSNLKRLRSLTKILEQSWDLLADYVIRHPDDKVPAPDLARLIADARTLAARREECKADDDRFLERLLAIDEWGARAVVATETVDLVSMLKQAAKLSTSYGQKKNWLDLDAVRADCTQLIADAATEHRRVMTAVSRIITRTLASHVLAAARDRQAEGKLDFHDLLVLSRDLLRSKPEVRERLSRRYRRLLLDEFQDTDPIQIELALRIAGGAAASAAEWTDLVPPPGSIFVVGDPKQSIYRFRRASIAVYMQAQARLGKQVSLTTNFRSGPAVIDAVNDIFSYLIRYVENAQPAYRALTARRESPPGGAHVEILGADAHLNELKADDLRWLEAQDVAEAVRTALVDKWQVWNTRAGEAGGWRDIQPSDIAILVPARTSLPMLEAALREVGIPYRAEASSFVYRTSEVRDLLLAARAVDDPTDELAIVSTLRSPLFGIGDDELWSWRSGKGRWSLYANPPEGLETHPVGVALKWLGALSRRSRSMAPSEVLNKIVAERRMLEVPAGSAHERDVWRRLRFVVDQARAWSESEHGGLREYLDWAHRQGEESARVSEAVLPERDLAAVRILTIHSAKGLEFPMVVLSGMTTARRKEWGVNVIWQDAEKDYSVRIGGDVKTVDYDEAAPYDEQLDDDERRRLLYVAFTRARDHLVVSLHRKEPKNPGATASTSAEIIHEAWDGVGPLPALIPTTAMPPLVQASTPDPAPSWEDWLTRTTRIRAASRRAPAVVASGLEGTAPRLPADPGLAKGARSVELPAWTKGRYGTEVGRAVHSVLQHIDLTTGAGLDQRAAAEAAAEEVPDVALVASLARAALGSDAIRSAAASQHWREIYVGTRVGDLVVEGFIDLVYRSPDGLVIIDYKTDAVPGEALESRVAVYRPQLAAYARALADATGEPIAGAVLVFLHPDGAVDRHLSAQQLDQLDLEELANQVALSST
jgi:ATP-dependent exoDNAse (exonuclease V) beta subunit